MYEWIERQIENICEDSHEYSETPDVTRNLCFGRLLQLEFLLDSSMIKDSDYLTEEERRILLAYLKTVETIIF